MGGSRWEGGREGFGGVEGVDGFRWVYVGVGVGVQVCKSFV